MSYCAIIPFKEGKPQEEIVFHNSSGGAAFIFTALFNRYLRTETETSWLWCSDKLWPLVESEDLEDFEKSVLASTFDTAIIRHKNFSRYVAHLLLFCEKHSHSIEIKLPCCEAREPCGRKHISHVVCHLRKWAEYLLTSTVEAVGFYHTSCGENLWYHYDECSDQDVPYDLYIGKDHFEIYDG